MKKIMLVIEDGSVKLHEILTDELRQSLEVLDLQCRNQGIQVTADMVSEIIGHRVVEVSRDERNPFEELMKTISPEMMMAEMKSVEMGRAYMDLPEKPSKKIPRNRRYNSPNWNF